MPALSSTHALETRYPNSRLAPEQGGSKDGCCPHGFRLVSKDQMGAVDTGQQGIKHCSCKVHTQAGFHSALAHIHWSRSRPRPAPCKATEIDLENVEGGDVRRPQHQLCIQHLCVRVREQRFVALHRQQLPLCLVESSASNTCEVRGRILARWRGTFPVAPE